MIGESDSEGTRTRRTARKKDSAISLFKSSSKIFKKFSEEGGGEPSPTTKFIRVRCTRRVEVLKSPYTTYLPIHSLRLESQNPFLLISVALSSLPNTSNVYGFSDAAFPFGLSFVATSSILSKFRLLSV